MNLSEDLQRESAGWLNTDDYNNALHAAFTRKVDDVPILKAHRTFVEKEQYGFGDRAFHYVWHMLINQMPIEFSFLEIGVFKGQVISLIALLAQLQDKTAKITGVTTLANTADRRCQYPAGDYLDWIHGIYKKFDVSFEKTKLVIGKSTDAHVLSHLEHYKFDIVYVDGSHDYESVVADIKNFTPKVKVGGFLVMDDASIGRLNIGSCWPGLEEVAQAVKEHLDTDPRFKFLFACGHLNLFQRIAE